MVQVAMAASELAVLHVSASLMYSAAARPVSATVRAVEAASPVLVTVKVTPVLSRPVAVAGKRPGDGVMVKAGATSPFPLSVATALPPGVAETVTVAFLVPACDGESVTE